MSRTQVRGKTPTGGEMKGIKRLAVAAAGIAVATSFIGSGIAHADPADPQPPFRALQGEGSDTTEGVMNALSERITNHGTNTKLIASFNALGATGFTTRH